MTEMTILNGGPVLWVLILTGVTATMIFFLRLGDLRRAHANWRDLMDGVANLLEKNNEREALAICADAEVPAARVLEAIIRSRGKTQDEMRNAAEDTAKSELRRMSRRISVLQTISQVSPLLGLLGAVAVLARMLAAFGGMQIATRHAFAAGMAPAFTCAAAGLLSAIVVQVMYALLMSRVDRLASELDIVSSEARARIGGMDR